MKTDDQTSRLPASAFKVADDWMASLSLARFVGVMSLIVAPSAVVLTGSLLWVPASIAMMLPIAAMRELGKRMREADAAKETRVASEPAGPGAATDLPS